ncbi:MAG: TolC family protein, partial [Cyclobacteriaceae bacterium]|nr:TolC family protein [Cyclobacteriaceae bacterium]
YALENNSTVKNAKLNEDISDAQVKEYTAIGLPQLNANVGYTHNLKVQTSFIPDFISPATYGVLFDEGLLAKKDLGEPATLPAAFGTKFSGNAGVSISQLVFDGSYFVGLKASKTVKELATKQSVMTNIKVAENVSKAYYAVLVSQQKLELLANNFSRIDSLLRDTKILEKNGFAEKIDVSRIKVAFNNTKVALTSSIDMLTVTISLLKYQMGMPMISKLTLTEKLEYSSLDDVSEVYNVEYNNHIEYSIMETNDLLNDLDLKNHKVQYMPRLYGFLNAGYTAGTSSFSDLTNFNSDTWFDYQNWGLSLNIPIFDGFQKKYAIQQRKLNKMQIENQFESVKNSIDLNIQATQITISAKISALEIQKENMELAEEVYRITEIKYKEGVGSNSEVLDADTALKEAQTNYYNALYEALVAKIDLDKAYGTLLKD